LFALRERGNRGQARSTEGTAPPRYERWKVKLDQLHETRPKQSERIST
jgi:hypothetical protein